MKTAILTLLIAACSYAGQTATGVEPEPIVEPGKPVFRIQPIELRPNLLPNASFETVEGNQPKSWHWSPRNTNATMTSDDSVARTGRRSLQFTNSTPFAPHVFGLLSLGSSGNSGDDFGQR